MKKKIFIFLFVTILLIGCGPKDVKADKKLIGTLSSSMDNQTLKSTIEIEYNSESGVATYGIFKTKYSGLEKTVTNNEILAELINRQSIDEQIEGIEVSLEVTDTSFDFEEKWDYNKVDMVAVKEADEQQISFIENDKYSITKIKEFYKKQKCSNDVIISASPEFLIAEVSKMLGVRYIASKVNTTTGALESKNCRGSEKVRRFKEQYPYENIENFYSDSLSDIFMAKESKRAYLIKGNTIIEWRV